MQGLKKPHSIEWYQAILNFSVENFLDDTKVEVTAKVNIDFKIKQYSLNFLVVSHWKISDGKIKQPVLNQIYLCNFETAELDFYEKSSL